MQIVDKKVAMIHYELKNGEGEILDTSFGRDPLAYIHGFGMLIPGLEMELEGKKLGDKIKAVIEPKDAYGEYYDSMIQIAPRAGFQQQEGGEDLLVGIQVQVETSQGTQIALVTKIEGDEVTLDLNHPLAGETLHFEVEIMGVREASADELSHRHVHGKGGHHH